MRWTSACIELGKSARPAAASLSFCAGTKPAILAWTALSHAHTPRVFLWYNGLSGFQWDQRPLPRDHRIYFGETRDSPCGGLMRTILRDGEPLSMLRGWPRLEAEGCYPEPSEDPTNRTPDSGLEHSCGADYRALRLIHILDPPRPLGSGNRWPRASREPHGPSDDLVWRRGCIEKEPR